MSAMPWLLWVDCETTGLDEQKHVLVEVALVVTDPDLVAYDAISVVLNTTDDHWAVADLPASQMHIKNGLKAESRQVTECRAQSCARMVHFVANYGSRLGIEQGIVLAGKNVASLDRRFLLKGVFGPSDLHYRVFDTQALSMLGVSIADMRSNPAMEHRAMPDVLQELERARRTMALLAKGRVAA